MIKQIVSLIFLCLISLVNANSDHLYIDSPSLFAYDKPASSSFTPADISDLELWFAADQEAYNDAGSTLATDGQAVQEWHDLSPNGRDLDQAVAGSRPTYVASGIGGQPSLDFDGSADFLESISSWTVINQPLTYFMVADLTDSNTNDGVLCGTTTSSIGPPQEGVIGLWALSGSWRINAGTNATVTPTIGEGIFLSYFNGVTSKFYDNGAPVENPGDPFGRGIGDFRVGTNASNVRYWDGPIAEVIVYSKELTDSEKNQVGNFLATKYSLTWNDI